MSAATPTPGRASLTPETERLLVGPLKVVMDHISEAFNPPRKARSGAGRPSTERMVWGQEGLGSWVALLAEQVCTVQLQGEMKCFVLSPVTDSGSGSGSGSGSASPSRPAGGSINIRLDWLVHLWHHFYVGRARVRGGEVSRELGKCVYFSSDRSVHRDRG